MVLCTRSHCYNTSINCCEHTQTRKRQRAETVDILRPSKAQKKAANHAPSKANVRKGVVRDVESRSSTYEKTERAGRAKRNKRNEHDEDRTSVIFPPFPSRSHSASRKECIAFASDDKNDVNSRPHSYNPSSLDPHFHQDPTFCPANRDEQLRSPRGTNASLLGKEESVECKPTVETRDDDDMRILSLINLNSGLKAQDEMQDIYPGFLTLGRGISPPTNLISPPNFVWERPCDPKFMAELTRAYWASEYRQALRERKYGVHVATEFRRGFTPEECREEAKIRADQVRAALEVYSDSK